MCASILPSSFACVVACIRVCISPSVYVRKCNSSQRYTFALPVSNATRLAADRGQALKDERREEERKLGVARRSVLRMTYRALAASFERWGGNIEDVRVFQKVCAWD